MWQGEFYVQFVGALHGAFGDLGMPSSSSGTANITTAVAVGVAITAIAGVAIAFAVGGNIFSRDGGPFRKRWRKRKPRPLTAREWERSFDSQEGRLICQGHKVIRRVRWGGIIPSIRADVWPFLLGVYDCSSSASERDKIDDEKRKEYENIRHHCRLFHKRTDNEIFTCHTEAENEELDIPKESFSEKEAVDEDGSCSGSGSKGRPVTSDLISLIQRVSLESAHKFWEKGSLALEELNTWHRIIRLDAVRMNAEWVPYSPSQANVSEETSIQLAEDVGLFDHDHLEPCRRLHASRSVAILEAYALYDPETGYCQGMSDLLSPFVALMDDDYKAFWSFAKFMQMARHNFRLDEVGIRRQLNLISEIIKVADSELYEYLVSIGAEDCTFVYRMVVVLLRRELSFEQTLCLWEVLWADWAAIRLGEGTYKKHIRQKSPATKDLLLFTIAAAVCRRRKILLEKCRGLDDILKECNAMSGHLNIWNLLDDARELVVVLHGKL